MKVRHIFTSRSSLVAERREKYYGQINMITIMLKHITDITLEHLHLGESMLVSRLGNPSNFLCSEWHISLATLQIICAINVVDIVHFRGVPF